MSHDVPADVKPALSTDPDEFWAAPPIPEAPVVEADAPDALDERGQPPVELGGGGLRRELESMYAVVRSDAAARRRWLDG